MNLKLHVTKDNGRERYYIRDNSKSSLIRFAVIDLDISRKYPINFVCVLPKNINPKIKMQTHFQMKFKEESLELAKNLLKRALKKEKDEDKILEIKKRLKILSPKLKMAKCNRCGEDFSPRKFGYSIQKTCNDCWSKL
ncbi:MAG: hypothetical protein NWF10_00860 [Candidatus Bathyarchaeota archaeon]|jgi:formylmethanofuran dehydrogenase subunit E|nr:hypothetical protein [Candidatus Bathyarchaeota archaeon]